jgi:hypothetical protein
MSARGRTRFGDPSSPPGERPPWRPGARRLRPLTVGALAVAHRRANAVGPVRLSCEADTLRVELIVVGRFASGYAFVGVGGGLSFRLPYTAVRGLVREGHTLHLALDPVVAAPYNRFALARFSRDPQDALVRTFQLRAAALYAQWLMPLPLAAAVGYVAPADLVGGWLGRLAVGLVVAFVCWQALRRLVRWISWGGPESDRLRAAFEHTVATRLGLEPAAELAEEPAILLAPHPSVEPPPPTLRHALGAILRPIAFSALALAATGLAVGAVLAVQRYGVAELVLLPIDEARRGLASPIRALSSAAVKSGLPERELCTCSSVYAPIWSEGVPQLGIVIAPRTGRVDSLWLEIGKTYPVHDSEDIEFDLAVINNSSAVLHTADLVVTFARRDARGRRRNLIERGLHWPADLQPGESVRWRVEATGTELKVDSKLDDKLGDGGITAAPAESFLGLSRASLSEVQVHGAMMLAYLRDERAPELARKLGPLSAIEEQARAQVLAALEPLQVCDVRVAPGGVDACLFNGSEALHPAMRVSDEGTEAPRSWTVRDKFLPGHGLRARIPTGVDRPPGLRMEAAR